MPLFNWRRRVSEVLSVNSDSKTLVGSSLVKSGPLSLRRGRKRGVESVTAGSFPLKSIFEDGNIIKAFPDTSPPSTRGSRELAPGGSVDIPLALERLNPSIDVFADTFTPLLLNEYVPSVKAVEIKVVAPPPSLVVNAEEKATRKLPDMASVSPPIKSVVKVKKSAKRVINVSHATKSETETINLSTKESSLNPGALLKLDLSTLIPGFAPVAIKPMIIAKPMKTKARSIGNATSKANTPEFKLSAITTQSSANMTTTISKTQKFNFKHTAYTPEISQKVPKLLNNNIAIHLKALKRRHDFQQSHHEQFVVELLNSREANPGKSEVYYTIALYVKNMAHLKFYADLLTSEIKELDLLIEALKNQMNGKTST